jgi:drug/metabolite transporter (DMT)-like permease
MAAYSIATRIVGRDEQASTSFFYLGVVGWLAISSIGPFYLQPVQGPDWIWFGIISITSIISHYLLIMAYNRLDAIQIQPISYFQLVWASMLGVVIFSETLQFNVALGSMIVVGAGLFTIWREAIRRREATRGFK